jgi:hypothetical protein
MDLDEWDTKHLIYYSIICLRHIAIKSVTYDQSGLRSGPTMSGSLSYHSLGIGDMILNPRSSRTEKNNQDLSCKSITEKRRIDYTEANESVVVDYDKLSHCSSNTGVGDFDDLFFCNCPSNNCGEVSKTKHLGRLGPVR